MSALLLRAGAMLVAFAVDRWLGEPPPALHPVVWMGKAMGATGAPWPGRSPTGQFFRGAVWWFAGAVTVLVAAWLATMLVQQFAPLFGLWSAGIEIFAIGLLLKPLLAWRMLREEVCAVEAALGQGLDEGRRQLSRLVSRDTRSLTEGEVRESTLESLAENLNDSLVAPLFWFAIAGLPGAAVYRFANTADAMWGYRDRWEWAGKWAARADDVLSYVPARLTALLLAAGGYRWPHGLAKVAQVPPSPNSGWPMGTLALVLGVRLTKPGVYVLNPSGSLVGPSDMRAGLKVCERAAWLAVGVAVGATAVLGALQ